MNAGLVATPAPGSIFAYLAVTPPGQHFAVLTGVLIAAVASFLAGSFILKLYPVKEFDSEKKRQSGAVRLRQCPPWGSNTGQLTFPVLGWGVDQAHLAAAPP